MVKARFAVGVGVLLTMTALVAPSAAGAGGVRAVLDGAPISLERAGELACHDFDYPVLTCFETSAELEAVAAERAVKQSVLGTDATAASATGYIVVFEHGAYAGAAALLSSDYSYLGDIGWNDKISSLKSYGRVGHFWEHAPDGGLIYYFFSTTRVPYVGDPYNDKFSALYFN